MAGKLSIYRLIVLLPLLVGVVLVVYPLFWMVSSSFKSYDEIFGSVWNLPSEWLFSNYVTAWTKGIGNYFMNSVIVTVSTIAGVVIIASLCAYGLSRFRFRYSKTLFLFVLGGMMLDPQVCLVPLYKLLQNLNIHNTYFALILPYIAFRLSIAVLLIRSYFLGIPKEIEESATMDGCSVFRTYLSIFLPMSLPIIMTTIILTSYYAWNEFLFSIIFIDSDKYRTIPAGLMNFKDALSTDWGVLLAGLVISSMPLIILFIFMQKYFIQGMSDGSVKG
ncbi:carbohydrate ABC transporter permease [Paenibacillus jilunlii]|uniref:ABC transporter permease n=1 Tax=Paenibacillus jilunlii TaxID=682956 RepID=A0A1G9XUF8_9BACL|nr:carbohydrate ABC transporter permease [Paenibacillus jilunlii]KWX79732.1 ABC transporter permease [Paenibacillus jilunlii]SDM99873.1 carbohydrate ABC transporter membrane protein 2, CUT1 family [Paenibacillus jilunlii]